jgi:hypothetical protein
MFDPEQWFKNRLADIVAAADPTIQKDIEKAAQVALPLGKALVDYFFLQLNGVGFNTQPVKKAEPADLPQGFRG